MRMQQYFQIGVFSEKAPATERRAPEDRIITEVNPSTNFDLENYISNYSGRCVAHLLVLSSVSFVFSLSILVSAVT